jgi:hypothetical protein
MWTWHLEIDFHSLAFNSEKKNQHVNVNITCKFRHYRVFEIFLLLQDNRSYTISVSAGPTNFLPELNTSTEICDLCLPF